MKNNKFTGYQLYNKDAKKRTKQNGLPNLYPELPDKQYDIIYADPPWHYNGKLQFDKTSTTKEKLDLKMAKIVRMELQNIITIKEWFIVLFCRITLDLVLFVSSYDTKMEKFSTAKSQNQKILKYCFVRPKL